MDWIVGEQVNVVNLSFAGPINMALLAIVQRTAAKNVVLVAAAGNDGPLSPPLYPAAFPKVIAVSALDFDRNPYPWNVQGKHIAFAAPGVNLPLPVAEAGGRIDLISGTSFAAPYVSGVVALWKSRQPQGGYAEAVDQLAAKAIRLRPVDPDMLFGHGLIQSPGPCS
jgi:subtilisin family serine protease